jgi:hypothetical protein
MRSASRHEKESQVLCHHYKCLFVHIPKTAGQSVEQIFLRQLGLKWETRAPLLLRYNDRSELGPPMLMHLKAAEYVRCRYMTDEQFAGYFKFSFVRNPWDRMVSLYRYLGASAQMDFKPFVMTTFRQQIWHTGAWFVGPQHEYLCDEHGELIVDFVGRFERLQADFNQVCGRVGLAPQPLPHVNPSTETESRGTGPEVLLREIGLTPQSTLQLTSQSMPQPTPQQATASAVAPRATATLESYQSYYDDETTQLVAELYRKDIDMFGYDF